MRCEYPGNEELNLLSEDEEFWGKRK